ncbi:hypothetical protein BDV38DRAFT_120778 [Aspergillus pseudotamarii]|uniref:Uncharacterized protein n=1 Tax=Aspergillus pseudotamarii TaxID=132259 RepID=A0A5N6SQF2_ASPPS|nr:uncharacterized protein BDV38DRAFT_120778 [Aspergillus pseudotamarii]KAE8135971.1 hypothetical protein BDV38DRAFT_120778 [Aspergillus pseudotamarii]
MNFPSDNFRPDEPSKRDPTIDAYSSQADQLERLLQQHGFKIRGLVVYRYTYQSDSDWEKSMTRFLYHVTKSLEYYNGLDLLESLAPTVVEDESFNGATTAFLRNHFQEWAATVPQMEQGADYSPFAASGRYRFFIMVDQEALESVLGIPNPHFSVRTGFVRLVNGVWEPDELDEERLKEFGISNPSELEPEEPPEGFTLKDVGWMKVSYEDAEAWALLDFE